MPNALTPGGVGPLLLEHGPVSGQLNVRITAQNDAQAVMAWLEEYVDSPQTWKAYRRESERLLLWLNSQGLTLADIHRDALRRFELWAFIARQSAPELSDSAGHVCLAGRSRVG